MRSPAARERVDRDRIAAALALLSLGAAWWFMRRRIAASSAAEVQYLPADFVAGLPELPVFEQLAGSAQSFAENIVSAITPGPWEPPARAAPYLPAIRQAEQRNGLPFNLLARLIQQESAYRADVIEGRTASSAGALGIAQIVPKWHPGVNPLDPAEAIAYAGSYLRQLYNQTGSWEDALRAYNWGIGNLKKYGADAAPLETRLYVAQIAGDVLT